MNLADIPSEYIEPYVVKFISSHLESIALGCMSPKQMKADLRGVEHFISMFGGIHSRLATSNNYYDMLRLNDDDLLDICRESYGREPITDVDREKLKKYWKYLEDKEVKFVEGFKKEK